MTIVSTALKADSATKAGQATVKQSGGQTLDYNAFLQLLIAQMKNQDPMDPMKSSDYVAQLATFSNVEKSVQMNERLGEILTSSRLSLAGNLVGKIVTSADGTKSGTIASVKVDGANLIATLQDGSMIDLGTGISIGVLGT